MSFMIMQMTDEHSRYFFQALASSDFHPEDLACHCQAQTFSRPLSSLAFFSPVN